MLEIPIEANRILMIWADYKRREGGQLTKGYASRSAGLSTGGASTVDSFDELVDAADRRIADISDSILDDMRRQMMRREVLAIENRYLSHVAAFRGDPNQLLIDGCRVFLIEAKRKGIAC